MKLTASYASGGVTQTAGKTITLAKRTVMQTIELTVGWNWVGFQVLPEKHGVNDVLGTIGFTVNDLVQTGDGVARFTGTGWIPSSLTIEFGSLYQIYTAHPVTLTIEGEFCETDTVEVFDGWNWVANPMPMTVRPEYLTHSGGWTVGDRIVGCGSFITYTGNGWVPSTGFALEPGAGYQIYTAKGGTLAFGSPVDTAQSLYVVVDLSDGSDAYCYPVRYTNKAPNLDDDMCRTTELWLRRIPRGTFIMGSPKDEIGRDADGETQHKVTLTQDYYIGVFECTQKQWELVMGVNPSAYKGDCCPVDLVSYDMIRGAGNQAGGGWPMYGHVVDDTSFIGILQTKTGLTFDLPTEAQWEYACRAGAATALNSGKNLMSLDSDANMIEVGRYHYDRNDGKGGYFEHTKVGSYLPNAWGLYDMHGNVNEWCTDWSWIYSSTAVEDPVGPTSGVYRVLRGGGWCDSASYCRSAIRSAVNSSYSSYTIGFRVVCLP